MGSLSDLLIMLAAGVLIVPAAQYLKLGAVPGFLLAGILVGPSVAGLISEPEEIKHISEFGVVFLLFVIGMEVNPSKLWHMRGWVFGMGLLQVLLTGTVLSLISIQLFNCSLQTGILIGASLSLSSTAFVLQLLLAKKALGQNFGRASFSVLLLQDLAVVPLLALIGFFSMEKFVVNSQIITVIAEAFALLASVIIAGRYLLQPVLNIIARSHNPEIFTATALLLVIGMALLTESVGLSMEMGAFIAGLLIADCNYRHQIMAEVQPFRGILLGLFFMSMGLSVNLSVFIDQPVNILLLTVGLIATKFIVLFPIVYLFRLGLQNSLATAMILAQSGEFALVIFAAAMESALLSDVIYQQLLLIVLFSMLLTPMLANIAFRIVNRVEQSDEKIEFDSKPSRIILAGFGRVGQRIGNILEQLDVPYVAIDNKPEIVDMAQKQGHPVFYGDARKPDIFKSLHMTDDSIVLITLDDFDAAENLVVMLSSHYPNAYILVRGHNANQCKILLSLGASDIVSENLEASIQLSRLALIESGIESGQYDDVLAQYKFEYYKQIS
jgi:monovalent cation:proton antiporter-2 (CPA2) family protein